MSIERTSGSATGHEVGGEVSSEPIEAVPLTGLDLIAELILSTALESDRADREASAAARSVASTLAHGRIEHMREAADWRLAAGLASGIATVGAAAAKGAGVAASSDAAAGGAADVPAVDEGWSAVSGGIDGAGKITSALLGWGADSANASAERERALAEEADGRSDRDEHDAGSSEALHGRMMASLAATVDEKRRAEEAATRA